MLARSRAFGVAALSVLAGLLPSAAPAQAGDGAPRRAYIVELQAPPLAAYRGEISGYAATSPAVTGRRFDAGSAAARHYRAQVDSVEQWVLSVAGLDTTPLMYRYRNALSGFAARLTQAEVQRLRSTPEVARISASRRVHVSAAPPAPGGSGLGGEGPDFLGLPEGLWARLGGPDHAGEGLVVGVIDTGIHPEHPSFAADPDTPPVYDGAPFKLPSHWRGRCQAGERWTGQHCNGKIVGARYFVEGYGKENLLPGDLVSARDTHGHGSHVAGTAAGNYGVDPRVGTNGLGVGFISGIAPRAHLAVYKTSWGEGESEYSDVVAAVDTAVADGVDVINFSSGGPDPKPLGPMEMALLAATEAGIFVASIAGNEGADGIAGPGDAPWVTAAAESTLARDFVTTVELSSPGERLRVAGSTVSGALRPVPLVDGAAAAARDAAPGHAALCLQHSLDPAKVEGKAVLCGTGDSAGAAGDVAVAEAGGVAVVTESAKDGALLETFARLVPTVEVTRRDGESIRRFLRKETGAEVGFSAGEVAPGQGDVIVGFSSRGPQANIPDVLKPDLAAPGHEILAAVSPIPAPPGYPAGLSFDAYSGTSMAAPHVAGAAALLSQIHPDWSPAALRSALMTTARTTLSDVDGTASDAFDMGAGRIDPNRAVDPGVVLDVTGDDYRRLVEGIDPAILPDERPPLRPADLNLPAVSFSALAGTASTRRTVTSVASAPATWRARVEGLDGIAVTVAPPEWELAPGASRALELDFRVEGDPSGEYIFGALVLSSEGLVDVRLPLSVRPLPVAAPAVVELTAAEASGRGTFEVQAGYDGVLSGAAFGLAVPTVHAGEKIGTFEGSEVPVEPGPGFKVYDVDVTGGTKFLRGEISGADGGDQATNLDLFLFFDATQDGFSVDDLMAYSIDDDSTEELSLPFPDAGRYRFGVIGSATRQPVSAYDFATWLVGDATPDDPAAQPGLTVAGDPVVVKKNDRVALTLEWSGLGPGATTYYGMVTYHRGGQPGSAPLGVSVVRIERREPSVRPAAR